ncbi:MAG: hypothetical protein MO852_14160, partial [Candidatus Devosia euplotis]|nr:hypothetical protein [Candidatus Devosia euplotis]
AVSSRYVRVRSISQASPFKEWFVLAVVATYQQELSKEVPALIEQLIGYEIPGQFDTLVTVFVMLVAICGLNRLFGGSKATKPTNLYRDRGQLISVAGDYINCTPEQIDSAFSEQVSGKQSSRIQKAALKFFAPVRGRFTTVIKGPDGTSISPEAIAEIPSDVQAEADEPQDQLATEIIRNARIELHAKDKDRPAVGWAGHIEGVTQDRVKMLPDKAIDPASLWNRSVVNGDIVMVYSLLSDRSQKPEAQRVSPVGRE